MDRALLDSIYENPPTELELGRLTRRHRAILFSAHLLEPPISMAEIAKLHETPINTVKSRLNRARLQLLKLRGTAIAA